MATRPDQMIQQDPFPDTGKVTTAVITGSHPFDVVGFHNMFHSLPEVECYIQHLEDFVFDWAKVRTKYDVVLFYNYHQDTPPADGQGGWWLSRARGVLEELGQSEQGIVVLHHAFNAYPQWEFWSKVVGMLHSDRTSNPDRSEGTTGLHFGDIRHEIADPAHPITQGLSAWEMYGEAWDFGTTTLGPDCHTVLLTDLQWMRLKPTAWTHQLGAARVFCLQPGHDSREYADPNFRTLLSRGIQWVAGRL
jgi:hypothetical protein